MRRRRRRKRAPKRASRPTAKAPLLPTPRKVTAPPHARSFLAIGAAALATIFFSGVVDAAPAKKAPSIAPPPPAVVAPAPPPSRPLIKRHFVPAKERAPAPAAWGTSLPSVAVTNNNTGAKASFRLYTDQGSLDLEQMKQFMAVVNGDRDGGALDTRLVQLAFRAAYHFNGAAMTIVSGTRKGAHGKHGTGEALDFKLEGVSASELARYVRTYPRAGIGIYTHPKTQYVHVDVRDRSYHWIDASPPGVTWREQLLADPKQAERDGSYAAASDLPESAR